MESLGASLTPHPLSIPACIFAKPFEPGHVKTRLAAMVGNQPAADLARAMFLDTWTALDSCPNLCPVLATTVHGDVGIAIPSEDIWLQGPGDLGQRLERILQRALQSAPAALAIGADSPVLGHEHLLAALASLDHHDAVMGPCDDGGFYLLGLRRCPTGLLADLPWSTAGTARAVTQRLTDYDFRQATVAPLFDIDIYADLVKLNAWMNLHPSAAPLTRRWMAANFS